MATKRVGGDDLPASAFLVVPDPDKPDGWALPVRDADGKPDHGRMGAAFAALTGGYRGNKYEGPGASEALKKLKALYAAEKMPLPSEGKSDDLDDDEWKDAAPFDDAEWKQVSFTVATDDLEPNEFKAYPAITGNVDDGGDLIPRGAFSSVLDRARTEARVYAEHGVRQGKLPIGRPSEVAEDSKGLFVRGKVSETTEGKDVLTLIRDGVIDRMSIGYKPKRVRYLSHQEGKSLFGEGEYKAILGRLPLSRPRVRVLEEFKSLFDFSFVGQPMNREARLLGYKAYGLPAGSTLEDHYSEVHAANEELLARFAELAEMRFKAGRMFSATNVSRLQSIRDDHVALQKQHAGLLQQLDDLIDAALPPDPGEDQKKAAEMAEVEMKAIAMQHLRFLEQQARRMGVPLT